MHERLGLQYQLARALVSIAVSVLWNFPMQRHYVFRALTTHRAALLGR
jgi:putative flippase GtrA